MKIYGKSFGEIFEMLPWQYKVVVVLSLGFFLFIFIHLVTSVSRLDMTPGAKPVYFPGHDNMISVYDPALAKDPVNNKIYLAHTNMRTVDIGDFKSAPVVRFVGTNPPCKVWGRTSSQFAPIRDEVYAPDGQTPLAQGIWQYETPALVYDPDDKGREWKLFMYKYFWTKDQNFQAARRYGGIVYYHTNDIRKDWSQETWLFSPAPNYPPAPYEALVQNHVNTLDESLSDVRLYSRPSALYAEGILLISFSAFTEGAQPDRIVMLVSMDHGATWKYIGTPLSVQDVPKIGDYTRLAGATLLNSQGKVYLAAVFGDETVSALGTFIFKFQDLSKGLLERDKKGVPKLFKHIPRLSSRPSRIGGGFAGFHDDCTHTGILTGEFSGSLKVFQIFETRERLMEEE